MRRTAIRLGWTDWRHGATLAALWLFYRFCNLLMLKRTHRHVEEPELENEVAKFANSGDKLVVWNFCDMEGRVYTVLMAQVCDATGKVLEVPHV
jgi:hypothetical protein